MDIVKNGYVIAAVRCEEEFLRAIDTLADDPQWRAAAARRSEQIASTFDKKAFAESAKAFIS